MKQREFCEITFYKKILIKIMVILLVFITGNFAQGPPKPALAVEIGGSSSGMSIDPEGMLFNIGNMAPGDKVTERLTVKNHEYFSFKYHLSSSLTDESVDSVFFFNNLNLVIKEARSGSVKYEGKLKDLDTIYFGSMFPKGQREFDCTLEFPPESGNEYQRLTTSFKFVVSAVQVGNGGGDEGGGDDPPDQGPPIVVPPGPEPPIVIPPGLELPIDVPPSSEHSIVIPPIAGPTTPVIIGLPDTGGNSVSYKVEQ